MDKYEIIESIKYGDTAVSEVLKIKDPRTDEIYVLKKIKGLNFSLNKILFNREVEALRKLTDCQNIVQLIQYDITCEKNNQCGNIYLEYIPGETLAEIELSDIDNIKKYNIIHKIISAICTAHEAGIIHRDINPNNIMIADEYETVKVIDFGISKIKDLIDDGTVYQFKTNYYSAPEVGQNNENADEKSDIYSLGAVIYYLLTGKKPCDAKEFAKVVEEEYGISTDIKNMIMKMIKYNPEERYESIFKIRSDYESIYRKLVSDKNKYVFQTSTDIIKKILRKKLSHQRDYNEMYQVYIPENFCNAYIYAEKKDDNYIIHLIGKNYEFVCSYDDIGQKYIVSDVYKLIPNIRDKKKKQAVMVRGQIIFESNPKNANNDNFELYNTCVTNAENFYSTANINSEYNKKFSAWHKLLEIIEMETKDHARKISYKSIDIENKDIILEVDIPTYYNFKDNDQEIVFIWETKKNGKTITAEVGNFKTKYIDEDIPYIIVTKSPRLYMQLPEQGIISEDYRKTISLIKRESLALKEFNTSDAGTITNLKGILSEVNTAKSFGIEQEPEYYNTHLDVYQRGAVRKALYSQDIALIQGPPGTGKTNVIIEIIRQIIKINSLGRVFQQKILVLSQAHAAVDNMLEDLAECDINDAQIIRIGRDEKLSSLVRNKYAVDYVKDCWIKEVIDKSSKKIKSILNQLNICEDDFYSYYDAIFKLKTNNISSFDKTKAQETVRNFNERYYEYVDKKSFKTVLIMYEWTNRIFNSAELPMYFIRNSVVVSGTCTGFLSNNAIHDMTFDYVIIDEAAKATFPELSISFIKGKKIILVGDHKQLPPILDEDVIRRNKDAFDEDGIDSSTLHSTIFERLFDSLPDSNKQRLNMQYRMHPVIGDMISNIFYDGSISNGLSVADRQHNIDEYKNYSIVWINTANTSNKWEQKLSGTTTYVNNLEAQIIKEQLKLIDKNMTSDKYDIGIITPYSGQKEKIRRQIANIEFENITGEIPVNSVDAFQGGQKDIIIYSTVRSNQHKNSGFTISTERINVSFSRAKRLLIIVGNMTQLNTREKNNHFPDIIKYMKDNPDTCAIIDYSRQK